MKTLLLFKRTIFLLFVLLFFQSAHADNGASNYLVFKNPTLISGAALQLGAVYRFDNVTNDGYALVTIDSLVNGATVSTIDDDGNGVGYINAFQPAVDIPGVLSASLHEAYAVFKIVFYNNLDNSLMNLQSISTTALDIDGSATVKELAEINMNGGSASYMSTTPDISVVNLLAGLKYRADNILGIERTGIDTSALANMFTVTNTNVNTLRVKYGAQSLLISSTTRQFSLYMQGFAYPNQITLPVKLIGFSAKYTKPNVMLEWSTAQEHNFNYFIIEHSTDGTNFDQTAIVFGAGESNSKIDYSYVDKDMKGRGGIIYYRLKQVDNDGKYDYSTVRIIRLGDDKTSMSITTYPNPATNDLRITLPASWQSRNVNIDLYNSSGKLVSSLQVANSGQTQSVSVASFAKGIYFVKATCGSETASQRVVKN